MTRVYYHYANGCRKPGTHAKNFETRERARSWIAWMNENIIGFVFDELI